jgi:hypothetical protein
VNEENSELRRMLEDATAVGDETPASLDPETAALRKSWLRLSQLIACEAAAGSRSQIPDVAENPKAITEWIEPQNEFVLRIERRNKARRLRWIVAAMAASLLIAAGVTATMKVIEGLNQPQPAPRTNPPLIAHANKPSTDSSAENTPQQRVAADHLPWGDSVDDEITAVGRAAALVRQDWDSQSSGIGAVQTGLGDLEKELDQGPL